MPVRHGLAGIAGGRRDHDPAAAHRLADVVVRLADEIELDPGREEGAEALAGRALETGAYPALRRARPDLAGDRPAEPRADGAIAHS